MRALALVLLALALKIWNVALGTEQIALWRRKEMAIYSATHVSLVCKAPPPPKHAQLPTEPGTTTLPGHCGLRTSVLLHLPCPSCNLAAASVGNPYVPGTLLFVTWIIPCNSPVKCRHCYEPRVTNKETEAQGGCETGPRLRVGDTELVYVPGCPSSQNSPLPSDTGAVVSGPGWPLPQLPLLRVVPKDSHFPHHLYGCHDIQVPCCPLRMHFLTQRRTREMLLLFYGSGHRKRKSFLKINMLPKRSLTALGPDLLCFHLPTS